LLADQLEGRIAKSLMPVMQIINNELNKVINFIKINMTDFTPSEILLGGEGALLPGLVSFFNLNLSLPVRLVNPLNGLKTNDAIKADIAKYNVTSFTVALGLALKSE
jgi:Tfp pilus assembly PilM family ATPase